MTKSEYKTLQSKFNEEIKQNEMQRYTDEENKTQCYLDDRIYRDGYTAGILVCKSILTEIFNYGT